MSTELPFLSLDAVRFAFGGGAPVVDAVSYRLPRGEIHCLLGRSGCGKTTLLRLAAGLLRPDAGSVFLAGRPLDGPGPRIGFVFQSPTLLDWLDATDNVLLPLSLQRRPTAADRPLARDWLARLGLGDLAERRPRELSGGQQARVALARALVAQPDLLLLDEPFASLDALTREALQDDLLALCAASATTALFVTHDVTEAVWLADQVAVMAAGRIVDVERPGLPRPRHPELRYAPAFVQACRRLRGALDAAPHGRAA